MDGNLNVCLKAELKEMSLKSSFWEALEIYQKIDLLAVVKSNLKSQQESWSLLAAQAKCDAVQKSEEFQRVYAEEMVSGPYLLARYLRLLRESLIAQSLDKRVAGVSSRFLTNKKGAVQQIFDVYPLNLKERLMLPIRAELWQQSAEQNLSKVAEEFPKKEQKIALVLGAGNINSIAPTDALDFLFFKQQCCILKLNPVNDYLEEIFKQIFKPLIDLGVMYITCGSREFSQALIHADEVSHVHITGAVASHDAIVWGEKDIQEQNKAQNTPILKKEISSELGAVTPLIVLPGKWSHKEMQFQTRSIASMLGHNASFNCNALKVIILDKQWPQRQEFLAQLRRELRLMPARKAYYPGAFERYEDFVERYPKAEFSSLEDESKISWTLLENLEDEEDTFALQVESFCGVLSVYSIDAEGFEDFAKLSVDFVNEKVFGTLSCAVICDSKSQRVYKEVLQQLLENLKYGGIALNCWPGLLFGLMQTSWGAFPGHTLQEIESGIGAVHNVLGINNVEKSIVRAPFIISPKPMWFYDHKRPVAMAKALCAFEHQPSFAKLISLAFCAYRG